MRLSELSDTDDVVCYLATNAYEGDNIVTYLSSA